jgi:hypothetical protein
MNDKIPLIHANFYRSGLMRFCDLTVRTDSEGPSPLSLQPAFSQSAHTAAATAPNPDLERSYQQRQLATFATPEHRQLQQQGVVGTSWW